MKNPNEILQQSQHFLVLQTWDSSKPIIYECEHPDCNGHAPFRRLRDLNWHISFHHKDWSKPASKSKIARSVRQR